MIGLVYSTRDLAGTGIANYISELFDCEEIEVPRSVRAVRIKDLNAILAGFNEDVIYFDFLDEVLNVDFYVVLSRHSAESGIKSLTVHHTGNPYGRASFGGNPYELSIANPPLTKLLLIKLNELRSRYGLTEFQVVYEATHHGPSSLKKPLTFIEIGSSVNEWRLPAAHRVVGNAVIEAIKKYLSTGFKCVGCVGFGGQHYSSTFTERALNTEECYGHIIPRYAINMLKNDDLEKMKYVFKQAILRNSIRIEKVVVLKKLSKVIKDTLRELTIELGAELLTA
ncbi:MAG: D-tyrosyl-tRNA(Tyr) deacylase [Desulfurococcales archaeon]|nr:D-tyrosyl-tRNA(Tyr) deacylase [Desulfurococcales archaeon]